MTFVRLGNNLAVAASGIAKLTQPAWYLNLKAHPRATVQVGFRKYEVTADEAPTGERETLLALFPLNVQRRFQALLPRAIPVMILRPSNSD